MLETRFGNDATAATRGDDPIAGQLPSVVLVVEDDDVDFRVVRDLLASTGCALERATNLKAAQLRVGDQGRPPVDVVIADLHLGDDWPAMTFDALALAWDHKPIIIVSGQSPEFRRVGRGPYPIVEIFDKNAFDGQAFLAAVETALHAGRLGDEAEEASGMDVEHGDDAAC